VIELKIGLFTCAVKDLIFLRQREYRIESHSEAKKLYAKLEKPDLNWLKSYQILDFNKTQDSVLKGTFDFSKSPDSYWFVKKHKCAPNAFSKTFTSYRLWRGIDNEGTLVFSFFFVMSHKL